MIHPKIATFSLLLLSTPYAQANTSGLTLGGIYDSEEQVNTHVNFVTQNHNLTIAVYLLAGLSALLFCFIVFLGIQLRRQKKSLAMEEIEDTCSSEFIQAQEEIKNLHLALQKERTLLVKHEVQMRELQDYIQELKVMQASKEVRHKTIEMQQKFTGQKTGDLIQKVENTARSLHPELVEKLGSRYPEINSMELQYCMMLVLGYNGDDIKVTLNRSDKAIKSLRYRIRKKMDLQEQEGLKEFLKQLTDSHSNTVKVASNQEN